jgi:hypothetical protein
MVVDVPDSAGRSRLGYSKEKVTSSATVSVCQLYLTKSPNNGMLLT